MSSVGRPIGRVVIAFSGSDSDQTAAASLADGFTRDGIEVERLATAEAVLAAGDPGLIVASLHLESGVDEGLALVRQVRERRGTGRVPELSRPPVIVVGDGDRRGDAMAAGANAFIAKPAFVKDIVTLAHIFAMPRDAPGPGFGGELGPLHLYYMVRALSASMKTGLLSLLRGGRRGELRFFEGEVTSAQVGTLHGQAAFHQLLLWPEAHFDLRIESVVRRHQIPLTPAELLQDAERFLRDFNEMASGISPASIFEQDLGSRSENVEKIPKEVMPVLRLFDGTRSVADVIEDSPLRLPETLKVVKNLLELKAIKKLGAPRPQPDAGAALLVEDWLVGQTPASALGGQAEPSRRKPDEAPAAKRDWGNLVASGEPPGYAPVVPSLSQTGEIEAVKTDEPEPATPAAVPEPAPDPDVRSKGNGQGPKTRSRKGKKELKERKSVSGVLDVPTPPSAATEPNTRSAAVEVSSDLPSVVVPTPAAPVLPPAKVGSRSGGHRAVDGTFEAHEEAFFKQEERFAKAEPAPTESFADLDDGQPKPVGFWKRLFGRPSRGKTR